jgi:hypothetical protein
MNGGSFGFQITAPISRKPGKEILNDLWLTPVLPRILASLLSYSKGLF